MSTSKTASTLIAGEDRPDAQTPGGRGRIGNVETDRSDRKGRGSTGNRWTRCGWRSSSRTRSPAKDHRPKVLQWNRPSRCGTAGPSGEWQPMGAQVGSHPEPQRSHREACTQCLDRGPSLRSVTGRASRAVRPGPRRVRPGRCRFRKRRNAIAPGRRGPRCGTCSSPCRRRPRRSGAAGLTAPSANSVPAVPSPGRRHRASRRRTSRGLPRLPPRRRPRRQGAPRRVRAHR